MNCISATRGSTYTPAYAFIAVLLTASALANPANLRAQADTARVAPTPNCASCAEWNAPQNPFRVYGNTYYVGTHGLGSILITSDRGDVLIDGGLQESAPEI